MLRRLRHSFFSFAPGFAPGSNLFGAVFLALALLTCNSFAATAVKVNFTLNTTDPNGAPLVESRYYYVYRPDGLSTNTPVPMVLVFEASPNSGPASMFNTKAAQVGFVVVSCSFSGNSTGTPGTVWNNDNPRITGWEDFDYTTAVINRVRASDNCNDAFICGISKGGHMTLAYACERPNLIKAAGPLDEFMGLTSNLPTAPVPIIMIQGTLDTNVPYTMVKDTVDAWRVMNGLWSITPITTCESSPLLPGRVTQATWRAAAGGCQVALVTIVGGTHTYPTPTVQTGYNMADGLWAFFAQYLTSLQSAPKIASHPVNNTQYSGQAASFWVAATGDAPLSYQWQKYGTNIPGATANCFTTPATTLADNSAPFRAVVANSSGSITSTVATLTVLPAAADPVILAQPTNQTAIAGQPFGFSVTASGAGTLSYQWRKNGMDLVGATTSAYNCPVALTTDCGSPWHVVVRSSLGSITSVVATLTVLPAPGAPVLITDPVRARILTNQAGTFSITAWSPMPMTYQWQKGVFTGNMTNIPGATASTYTTPMASLADHLTLFRCAAVNADGAAVSAAEMLMVTTDLKAPTDITSLIDVTAQAGVPFGYTITSSGGTAPITYSAAPLPAGLVLNPATGVISGTPNVSGGTAVLLTASNSAGSTTATLTLKVQDTAPVVLIDAWRSARFGASARKQAIAGDLADPDNDGIQNLFEYATGTDPLAKNPMPWAFRLSNGYLTVSVAKDQTATNVTWGAESSSDLRLWNATNTTVLQNTPILFEVRDNYSVPASSCRFLRLRLSSP